MGQRVRDRQLAVLARCDEADRRRDLEKLKTSMELDKAHDGAAPGTEWDDPVWGRVRVPDDDPPPQPEPTHIPHRQPDDIQSTTVLRRQPDETITDYTLRWMATFMPGMIPRKQP